MSSVNQLLSLLPTRPLREILMRSVGGVVVNGTSDEVLMESITAELAAVEMLAYHISRSTTLYLLTLLTPTALIRVEVFPDGGYATRVVPMARVRQVSEQRILQKDPTAQGTSQIVHEIVIEFDAGVAELVGVSDTVTVSKPGGWVLVPERTPDGIIPPSATDQMILFGSQLRHLLATRPI